jgi:hypothetical protein
MNLRLIITGALLIIVAGGFFLSMWSLAPQSNDPAALMRTVGMVSGGGVGLGTVMIVFGLTRRKQR